MIDAADANVLHTQADEGLCFGFYLPNISAVLVFFAKINKILHQILALLFIYRRLSTPRNFLDYPSSQTLGCSVAAGLENFSTFPVCGTPNPILPTLACLCVAEYLAQTSKDPQTTLKGATQRQWGLP